MTAQLLTPYAAAKAVNQVLAAADLAPIPPQMMYNYTTARLRAGKNPLITCNAEGQIAPEDLQAWLTRYLSKKGIVLETNA